jgi:RNase P/RNase MRP subunit p30
MHPVLGFIYRRFVLVTKYVRTWQQRELKDMLHEPRRFNAGISLTSNSRLDVYTDALDDSLNSAG